MTDEKPQIDETSEAKLDKKPLVVRSLLNTKGAIEFFGRHPFITGIFALLGLVGLGLSVRGFAIDRVENEKSVQRDAETTESLKGMSAQIEKINTPAEPDKPLQIRDSKQTHDSWTFSREHMGQSKDWIIQNVEYTGSAPYLNFSVTSDANKQFVQVAPYLAISVDKVRPFPEKVASIFYQERGRSAVLREFTGLIKPQDKVSFAPLDDMSVDYITLMPGEVEEFFLTLNFEPGYRYEYRVGLVYRFQGQDSVEWLPYDYTIGIPGGEIPVAGFDDVTFTTRMHDDVVGAENFNAETKAKITTALEARKFMQPETTRSMILSASQRP